MRSLLLNVVEWVEAAAAIRVGHVDAQIYFCNLEWFNRLPKPLRASIDFASEMTMRQNHAKVPAARAHAEMQMATAGVQLNQLAPDEKAQWINKVGAQLSIWDGVKKKLAGSLRQFDKLKEAVDTPGNYYVPER